MIPIRAQHSLQSARVAVAHDEKALYPTRTPYHPHTRYPEYLFSIKKVSAKRNSSYTLVRELFVQLGYDMEHFGTSQWNPLGKLIAPGQIVVIKPNAVLHYNQKKGEDVFASITHGSVLRPIIDYVYIALKGKGRIIIADAPLAHSDFDYWKQLMGLAEIVELYQQEKQFLIEVYDLRNLYVPYDQKKNFAPSTGRDIRVRDPFGYLEVDLKSQSEFRSFTEQDVRRLFGADYDRQTTVSKHLFGQHKYFVAKTMLEADVVISVPKMKVHCKVGTTLNIKGMVGTQGDKNYIPHHRIGPPSQGGDEFPEGPAIITVLNWWRMWLITHVLSKKTAFYDKVYQFLNMPYRLIIPVLDKYGKTFFGQDFRGVIYGGSWYGNDTAWRMSLDLLKINLYCDKHGQLHQKPQRTFFSVVDGIMAGQDDGPLAPTGFPAQMLIAGTNPLAVDVVTTHLMGFDSQKIKMYQKALQRKWLNFWGDIKHIDVQTADKSVRQAVQLGQSFYTFIAPKGWRKAMENTKRSTTMKTHYDQKYFAWQSKVGQFGGKANLFKFQPFIHASDTVLDFGSGGGFLLQNLHCRSKIGVEINPIARKAANQAGIKTVQSAREVNPNSVDVIISNHCLEHCERPIDELRALFPKLKKGGKIIIVVPCERRNQFSESDQNKHLYTWSPMTAGNMLAAAGFTVIQSEVIYHTWPLYYHLIQKFLGWPAFHLLSRINGRLFSEIIQVRAIGVKQ